MPAPNSVPELKIGFHRLLQIALSRFLATDKRLSQSILGYSWNGRVLHVFPRNTEATGIIHQKLPSLARFLVQFDFVSIYCAGQEFLIEDLARVCPRAFKNLEGPIDRKLRLLQASQAKSGFYRHLLDSV